MNRRVFGLFVLALVLPLFTHAADCLELTRNLSRGMHGQDVQALQQQLIRAEMLEVGNDTGYFGAFTEAAVQKYQCANEIVCEGSSASTGWGSVGPKTRAVLAAPCTTSQSTPAINVPRGDGTCQIGYQTLRSGASVTAFKEFIAPYGSACVSEVRRCHAGTLSGTYTNLYCAVDQPASCTVNGSIVFDGQFKTFYSAPTVNAPRSCVDIAELRECRNGVLTGPPQYMYASCIALNGTSTPLAAPKNLRATCSVKGTQLSLGWDPVAGAVSYSVRIVQTGTTSAIQMGDWLATTTYSIGITPDTYYSWWVHSNPTESNLGQFSVGDPLQCASSTHIL